MIEFLMRYIFHFFFSSRRARLFRLRKKSNLKRMKKKRRSFYIIAGSFGVSFVVAVFWLTHQFVTLHGTFPPVIGLCNIKWFSMRTMNGFDFYKAIVNFPPRNMNVKLCNRLAVIKT